MSKTFELPINTYLQSKIEKPIREKTDIIILLLETINLLLIGDSIENDGNQGKIIIYIDKMSRIVYQTENKMFSVNFPFFCEIGEDGYIIRENDIIFNFQIVSELMSIIIDIQQNNDIDSILGKIIDSEEIYRLIIKMLKTEYGYVRYDYDQENCNGNLHPLNHLDVNFSSNVQYKLGLENTINLDTFIDILDLKTDCYFLNKN